MDTPTIEQFYLAPEEAGLWGVYASATVGYDYTIHGPRRRVDERSVRLGFVSRADDNLYTSHVSQRSEALGEPSEAWLEPCQLLCTKLSKTKAGQTKLKKAGLL